MIKNYTYLFMKIKILIKYALNEGRENNKITFIFRFIGRGS